MITLLMRALGYTEMHLPDGADHAATCALCGTPLDYRPNLAHQPQPVGTYRRRPWSRPVRLMRCPVSCIIETIDHPDLIALIEDLVPGATLFHLGISGHEPAPEWVADQPLAVLHAEYERDGEPQHLTTQPVPRSYALDAAVALYRLGVGAWFAEVDTSADTEAVR